MHQFTQTFKFKKCKTTIVIETSKFKMEIRILKEYISINQFVIMYERMCFKRRLLLHTVESFSLISSLLHQSISSFIWSVSLYSKCWSNCFNGSSHKPIISPKNLFWNFEASPLGKAKGKKTKHKMQKDTCGIRNRKSEYTMRKGGIFVLFAPIRPDA